MEVYIQLLIDQKLSYQDVPKTQSSKWCGGFAADKKTVNIVFPKHTSKSPVKTGTTLAAPYALLVW